MNNIGREQGAKKFENIITAATGSGGNELCDLVSTTNEKSGQYDQYHYITDDRKWCVNGGRTRLKESPSYGKDMLTSVLARVEVCDHLVLARALALELERRRELFDSSRTR